nr:hypothetical protein 10 [Spirochaetaceae bacterium]BDD44753.1 hypothetical protein 11 [bacterium]BDD45566.1 hypothetical protein 15 [bacterium]
MVALSCAEKGALRWLADRGGDGVFAERNRQVLIACGERSPVARRTWNSLRAKGLVEAYGIHRLRIITPERNLP